MNKKRRIFQANPKYPSPIRTTFPTEFRSSESESNAAKVDEPKTSEYAFFKKLKTNAGRRFNSHPLQKEEIQPNKFKSSEFLRGVDLKRASTSFQDMSNLGKGMEALRPGGMFLLQNPGYSLFCQYWKPGQNENVEPLYSETWLNDDNCPPNQNKHDDLFSRKRQKLHQWVADISYPEIEELCSKGYDFVSVLLSRLFAVSNEENRFQISKSERVEGINKSNLLSLPKSNNQLKELHRTSTKNFLEAECVPYLENGSSACWLDSLRKGNSSNSGSLTYHADNVFLDCDLREPCWELRGKNKISWIDSDSAFSFPLKNYGHFRSVHIRELDDFQDPGSSLLRTEQHPLLLELDSENLTNERTSLVSKTELIMYPSTLTSFADDHGQSLREFGQLGDSELCVPSFICEHSPNFHSLPPSHSTVYCKDDGIVDNEDIAADLNNHPLTLSSFSHMPRYAGLTEGCHNLTASGGSRTFLSPGNDRWFMREVSCKQHYDPGTEDSLSSELSLDFRKKCLAIGNSSNKHYSFTHPAPQFPQNEGIFSYFHAENEDEYRIDWLSCGGILNHHGQDMVNIDDWSSFYFQISPDKEKSCPLLPYKMSWDASEGELS
ncbi:uncharacterized protein LOC102617869 isoform X9 [Citrus sinensis]|uniref:uncharacterized protein LOC102617869 isoform X9 n=1 Tax=Citrus sinensis TaxID=2711 RepID=UPI002279A472|nr:uncharacterized protein LOC102617869 isoform X9 [Citrus sinensis]